MNTFRKDFIRGMTNLHEKLKTLFRRAYASLIGERDLWQQLLNIAVLIAIGGAFVSTVISVVIGNSPMAIAAIVITALFAVFCLILSLRSKDVIYAAVLFSVVASFILFPLMYFSSGGYHGGMPIWLLLGLVISWVVIRSRVLYIVYGLGLLFQCGCIIFSEQHPETVVRFESEHAEAMDVIQSLILVSLIFGITFKYQSRAYEKQKKELDTANAVLSETNEKITFHAMYTLAKTIDAKDRYTNGHSMRVAKYSGMLARKKGLSEAEVEKITNMAMLHDIGKIGVSDAIINKTSKLTEDEYDIVKRHPVIGYEILSEMPEMRGIGLGARWHHERYDGTGYPDGLRGLGIPLAARIICVADAYDAMTSNRSYRKFMQQDAVKRELEKGKETQFDPEIAGYMLEIMEEDPDYELHEK